METAPPRPAQTTGIVGMSSAAYARVLVFFLAPAVLVYTLFSVYPLVDPIVSSVYDKQNDCSYVYY